MVDAESRDEMFAKNLAIVQGFLEEWKSLIDGMGTFVIEPSGRTFDSIAFSLLNKAFRVSKASLTLLIAGYSDEAFGLARSLIECSLALRYMTIDLDKLDLRSNNYVDFAHCERKHFLEQCRKYFTPGPDLEAVEAFARSEGLEKRWAAIVPDRARVKNIALSDWKQIEGKEWDGWRIVSDPHPLDGEINQGSWIKKQYAADYRGGSAMLHCTIRALDNVFVSFGRPFKVGEGLKTTFDHRFEPLLMIVTNLYLAARYVLYGAKIEDDVVQQLTKVFNETIDKLEYARQA